MATYIIPFNEIRISDIPRVGGKNASLGEMYQELNGKGILVPNGFATTSKAYWTFLEQNRLNGPLAKILSRLDTVGFENLNEIGSSARELIMASPLPITVIEDIIEGYRGLKAEYGDDISLAVRSSATAEDLPNASFAGQQETFLNINGEDELLHACHRCYASLFTNRAIKYRQDSGFDHMKVALSVGIQLMVRSDKASSGVIFTLEPDTGFENIILVSGAWGLGENVVQGSVNVDEFYVFKPGIKQQAKQAIVARKLGSKELTMVYNLPENVTSKRPEDKIVNLPTPVSKQEQYILNDEEVALLAKWALQIEEHYQRPMDIEWAKDGLSNQLFIVQARPETVFSSKKNQHLITTYHLEEKSNILATGIGLGNKITSGTARVLNSPDEAYKLKKGEVLITDKTNPDWDPILKKAAAIITNQGGRTSHAAIVARELGAVAIVGSLNATEKIKDGQEITVCCAQGENGIIYDGKLQWQEGKINTKELGDTNTEVKFILGDPEQAFRLSFYPNNGIGLMRLEFVINNTIQIHPLALKNFDKLTDEQVKQAIEEKTAHYPNKEAYFINKLSESVATIAAAFYPKEVIVRMSDFKSNEYANLLGGQQFEPKEENPMIGWRGASRYYHPGYSEGFEMECKAMKVVREDMGLDNLKLMIPFCRTEIEAQKVLDLMASYGLKRGEKGLEVYMMAEIPSNIILADQFADYFDGFSIGSNDLTQLTLGVDRDSELLNADFDARDPAVKAMIAHVIKVARDKGIKIGLCGQAASDFPEFAQFLVQAGIHSISFNPDALVQGIQNIQQAEALLKESVLP